MGPKELAGKLTNDVHTRIKVFISLETNHIHNCIKRHYEESLAAIKRSSLELLEVSSGSCNVRSQTPNDWDWKGIRPRRNIIDKYHYFSTFFMLYAIFRNSLLDPLQDWAREWLHIESNKPWACYTPGRFQISENVVFNKIMGTMAALANLLWPYFQWNRSHRMTTPYFLLFSSRDLNKYYALLENDMPRNGHLCSYPRVLKQDSESYNSEHRAAIVSKIEEHDHVREFFNEVMSHKIPMADGKSILQLRPNRTREANIRLKRLITYLTIYFNGVLIIFTCITTVFVVQQIFKDQMYFREYPGCAPDLEEEFKLSDATSAGSSYTLLFKSKLRFFTAVIDFIENLILWIEMDTIAYGIEFAVILNYDLLAYWRYLHSQFIDLSHDLKMLHLYEGSEDEFVAQKDLRTRELDMASKRIDLEKNNCRIEDTIRILQFQTHDFIREIEKVNIFLADIITIALLIWVGLYSTYVYIFPHGGFIALDAAYVSLESGDQSAQMLILLVPLSCVTVTFFALLTLHRCCLKTYPILCTVMAYYNSPKKKSLIPILAFFNERRTCYKLFRMSPLMPTTFLSLIGWTFSCFFIVRGLFQAH